MDGPRDPLLARAALARDEHRGPHRSDAADQLQHPSHGGASTKNEARLVTMPELRAQPGIFLAKGVLLERLRNQSCKLGGIERLGNEVVGAGAHRGDGVLDRGVGGDENDLRGACTRLRSGEHLQPRPVGHGQIGEHDGERLRALCDRLEREPDARSRDHVVPLPAKEDLEHLPERGLVVDDEKPGRGRHDGIHSGKLAKAG